MNYILIIYLIGVLINSYIAIGVLKTEYNDGKVLTIGGILGYIIVCLTSWLFLLCALIAWLCINIYIILCKPLFKKHK